MCLHATSRLHFVALDMAQSDRRPCCGIPQHAKARNSILGNAENVLLRASDVMEVGTQQISADSVLGLALAV